MRFEFVNKLTSSAYTIDFPGTGSGQGEASEGYLDLRQAPIGINRIAAARENPPLAGFLAAINSSPSIFCTVRVKTWAETDAQAGADESARFLSRLDVVFAYDSLNQAGAYAEDAARRLAELWMKETDAGSMYARVELLPCRFPCGAGGALRISLCSCGVSAEQARMRWGLAIAKLQQSLLFVSRAMRQKLSLED